MSLDGGLPRYRTSLSDRQDGQHYVTLSDAWGVELRMDRLDELSVDCSLAVGFAAHMRFGSPSGWGDPIPVKVGDTNWDRIWEKSEGVVDRVQFRNAVAGSNAQVFVEMWGK